MKFVLLSLALLALTACTAAPRPAPKDNGTARVENEGNTPYNRMRYWAASMICALALTACSDTHQAVPVDDVSISDVGDAQ